MLSYLDFKYSSGRDKLFIIVTGIIALIVVTGLIYVTFFRTEERIEQPIVLPEQLVVTSPKDIADQSDVARLVNYDWTAIMKADLDDKDALKAVPYLITLELESTLDQHDLLRRSQKYVGEDTLNQLSDSDDLKTQMENLAIIEEAFYDLGLPSGLVHAERYRHLAQRLAIYYPPIGPIPDIETTSFVEEHLGYSVSTFQQWYIFIKIRHDSLVSELEQAKGKTSITKEEYLRKDATIKDVVPI